MLQERRTYIPQGWTKFYEFSPADLRSAADICDAALGMSRGDPDAFLGEDLEAAAWEEDGDRSLRDGFSCVRRFDGLSGAEKREFPAK